MEIHRIGDCFSIRSLNLPWHEVLHLGQRQSILKGKQWNETDQNQQFSYLQHGHVQLITYSTSGSDRILLNIYSGCIFREVLHLNPSVHHPVRLVAKSDCVIVNFPMRLLRDKEFIATHPHLMSNLVQSLSIKAGAFSSQIFEEELRPSVLVCRHLFSLYQHGGANSMVNPNMSQSELALTLGLHRSTVSRVLKELRSADIVGRFTRCMLEVNNPAELLRLCAFSGSQLH
ncbi:Crp/Fnr family transcriptional regulator [Desulfovibrionales bacterium]